MKDVQTEKFENDEVYYEFGEEQEKKKMFSWLNVLFFIGLFLFGSVIFHVFYVKSGLSNAAENEIMVGSVNPEETALMADHDVTEEASVGNNWGWENCEEQECAYMTSHIQYFAICGSTPWKCPRKCEMMTYDYKKLGGICKYTHGWSGTKAEDQYKIDGAWFYLPTDQASFDEVEALICVNNSKEIWNGGVVSNRGCKIRGGESARVSRFSSCSGNKWSCSRNSRSACCCKRYKRNGLCA